MSEALTSGLLAEPAVEWLYLRLDPQAPAAGVCELVEPLLPACSWQLHLVLWTPGGGCGVDEILEVMEAASRHLRRHPISRVLVHPVVDVALDTDDLEKLVEPLRSFQSEAYREQTDSRLLLLPILAARAEEQPNRLLSLAVDFRSRLSTPCVLCLDEPAAELRQAAGELRLYLAGDPDGADPGPCLLANHVVDGLLGRVDDDRASPLAPCPRHLVIDQLGGEVYPCLRAWQKGAHGLPAAHSTLLHLAESDFVSPDWCASCVPDAVHAMGETLTVNHRRDEGQRLSFRLALAIAGGGDHGSAAAMARQAFELADSARARAAALVQEGLCRLAAGELEAADSALLEAAAEGADPRTVAFQRGRVQVAWRDDIEALDRFAEALAATSSTIPDHDLHFEMALSHVKLEEFADARRHLELASAPGREAPLAFYLGICELGEGRPEDALDRFESALALEPDPEDLARVLFYIGHCHKELERHEEAIAALERSLEVEPDELATHNLLGYCYYRLHRHEEAVACFERTVALDPSSAIDWASLGSNLRDLGRTEEAVDAYRKALALDPSIDFARENLERLAGA